tara:strand:+ start:398 stop:1183 length:786 start_codon:yes stop_codon:yes gene_type:complete
MNEEAFLVKKRRKLDLIRALIKKDVDFSETELSFDCLPKELRMTYGLAETDNVSAHGYDEHALQIIKDNQDGLVLDCGSGKRSDYLENVVNFEIVPYESTDVIGLGEHLPFRDESFDAVFSLNVLEHVKDPFACAKEIARVLKPSGKLYCVAAFLQPVHAFPDHYFNMTKGGMRLLFEKHLKIDRQSIIRSGLPIFTLTWILQRWVHALPQEAKEDFMSKRVSDLLASPIEYIEENFVKNLPEEMNEELASTTALFATKSS